MIEERTVRKCPNCNKTVFHKTKYQRNRAEKDKVKCRKCIYEIRKPSSSLFKHGQNPWNTGKKSSNDTKERISKNHADVSGKNNPMYGVSRKGLRKGYKHSSDTIKKLRLSAIKRLEKNEFNGGQVIPNYNPSGCEYFNKLMEQTNTHIQHAENGGEYHIKELGYWVDGYDEDNNIVYEYDEEHHKYQKEKDEQRQIEIENFLQCKFIRIKHES